MASLSLNSKLHLCVRFLISYSVYIQYIHISNKTKITNSRTYINIINAKILLFVIVDTLWRNCTYKVPWIVQFHAIVLLSEIKCLNFTLINPFVILNFTCDTITLFSYFANIVVKKKKKEKKRKERLIKISRDEKLIIETNLWTLLEG